MSTCPGCGLELPAAAGPAHPYIGASPECWALYGRALERAYSDPREREVLQLVVDAYACQHPGEPGRRSAQSVGIHLMTLCLFVEQGAEPREGSKLHGRMVERPELTWLEPPRDRGSVTVAAMIGTADYHAAAWEWARAVWSAWSAHHETVRGWLG